MWERLDRLSHHPSLRWLLPRWVQWRICDAFDRSLGMFDEDEVR